MEQSQEGTIIKVIKRKGATISINGNCVAKTEEAKKQVDAEITSAAWAIVNDLRQKGIDV